MTIYHAFVITLSAFSGGVFCGLMYAKHGLGWIPAFEADLKAELAKIIVTLEHRGAAPAVQPTPPSGEPSATPGGVGAQSNG